MPRYTVQGQTVVNEATIAEDVELAASGITFTNTELGRVLGRFLFTAGGATLINQRGGYIGAPVGQDAFTFEAVIGSSGNDTIIDRGNIQGRIRLGDGNDVLISNAAASSYANSSIGADMGAGDDLLRFEGSTAPFFAYGNGGEGFDTFEFAATTNQVFGTHLTGFEALSLRAGGNYIEFSGYTQVTGASGQFFNLIDSDNPLADLVLNGSLWILQSSDFRSIVGGDADDALWIGRSTLIAQPIAMGAGNDTVRIEVGATAAGVAPSIDGGAGSADLFAYAIGESDLSDSLATVTGFERLRLSTVLPGAGQVATLSDLTGFTDIYAEAQINLHLASGQLAGATVGGALGGSITLASGITVAAYRYASWGSPRTQRSPRPTSRIRPGSTTTAPSSAA